MMSMFKQRISLRLTEHVFRFKAALHANKNLKSFHAKNIFSSMENSIYIQINFLFSLFFLTFLSVYVRNKIKIFRLSIVRLQYASLQDKFDSIIVRAFYRTTFHKSKQLIMELALKLNLHRQRSFFSFMG